MEGGYIYATPGTYTVVKDTTSLHPRIGMKGYVQNHITAQRIMFHTGKHLIVNCEVLLLQQEVML